MSIMDTGFDSYWQIASAAIVIAGAQLVYMLLGFGAGMIALGLLALVTPTLQDAVVIILLVSLPIELFVTRASWRQIHLWSVLPIAVGILLAVPLGAAYLRMGRSSTLVVLMGGVFLGVGVFYLTSPRRSRVHWPKWSPGIVGGISGFLAGALGTGGPPLVAYYQLQGIDKSAFRVNLITIFLIISLVRLPCYALAGLLDATRLRATLLLLPASLLGAWLGARLHLHLNENAFRRAVGLAVSLLGILTLATKLR